MKDLSGRVFGTDLEIRQDARERNISFLRVYRNCAERLVSFVVQVRERGAGKGGMRARRVLACARRWSRVREKPRDSVEMIGKSGEKELGGGERWKKKKKKKKEGPFP